jgi:hypothetical protein
MGAVFRPKDLPSGRKRIIENAVRDFSPDVKDDVVKILESWERTGSKGSEEKLKIRLKAYSRRSEHVKTR